MLVRVDKAMSLVGEDGFDGGIAIAYLTYIEKSLKPIIFWDLYLKV
jgi:hypothetical protein